MMPPNSILEINLGALAENVRQIRGFLSPGTELCAVVKANAYGLGASVIAPELEKLGVKWLAVYDPWQAEEILRAGVTGNVLILMPVTEIEQGTELAAAAKAGRIHCTVHGAEQMRSLAASAKSLGAVLPVHVEIDTGMSRGGQLAEKAKELVGEIRAEPNLSLAGIFTHPSSADSDAECTEKQLADFDSAMRDFSSSPGTPGEGGGGSKSEARNSKSETAPTLALPRSTRGGKDSIIHHFANTWAAIADKKYHGRMVRVGLGLWGYPSTGTWDAAERNGVCLRPIARWVSRIVHVKEIPAQAAVGYGQTFRTARPTRVGIVPAGYADGYPLLLSNCGTVRVGQNLAVAPVIGRVNMDQIMVDLTDAPEAKLGSEAELISSDPGAENALHKLAGLAQSHPYEMLCRISAGISRKYLKK